MTSEEFKIEVRDTLSGVFVDTGGMPMVALIPLGDQVGFSMLPSDGNEVATVLQELRREHPLVALCGTATVTEVEEDGGEEVEVMKSEADCVLETKDNIKTGKILSLIFYEGTNAQSYMNPIKDGILQGWEFIESLGPTGKFFKEKDG